MYYENKDSEKVINHLRNSFTNELLSKELINVWINGSEIFSIMNDLYPSEIHKRYEVIRNLLPLLDSFFTVLTIMNTDRDKDKDLDDVEENDSYS